MAKPQGPALTVDALIEDEQGRILVIKRGVKPFKGSWCLPGGKVGEGERVEAALEREVMEELGVRIGIRELTGIYSDPDRDPRGHYVTAVFHATIIGGEPTTTDEAADIEWISVQDKVDLGFDHDKILQDWWVKKDALNGRMPGRPSGKKKDPRPHSHPVDAPLVKQVEDERIEKVRLVEDEAARGKRAGGTGRTKPGPAKAVPMKGKGTKLTGVAARPATGPDKRKR